MTVAVISDHIDSKVMASGLSVEAQISTLFQVLFAPVVGALADWLGIGPALAIFGAIVALLLTVVSVKSGRSLRGASDVRV